MTVSEFVLSVIGRLGYEPNPQQRLVIEALARFCSPVRDALAQAGGSRDRVFVLSGYAGTGKTSLSGALVSALADVGVNTVLMAPTGRAAKVFSAFAGRPAYTIHRRIYRHSLHGEVPSLQENRNRDTVFLVDEASMIGDFDEGGGSLLRDLVQYVYSGENCRMILLGDTAQLPPVGSDFSPAMDTATLREMGLSVSRATLTAIARQGAFSGILANATALRRDMRLDSLPQPRIVTEGFDDVHDVVPADLPELLDTCYRRDGMDSTILVTRSNRSAVDFNRAIRAQVLYIEEEISRGELILVTKNNYRWSRGVKGLDFIANGDTFIVEDVYGTETRYGMRFADVRLSVPDRPENAFDCKIILDTLFCDAVSMTREQQERLYRGVESDIAAATAAAPRNTLLAGTPGAVETPDHAKGFRDNPYWNALRVKYAYAVTCHKAQGGQWTNVIVDMGYVPPEGMGVDFYRWLYTAVTRARTRLYVIRPQGTD